MTIVIVMASVAGYVAHQTRRYTDILAHGWRDLVNYAIGVVGSIPFAVLLLRLQPRQDGDDESRCLVAMIIGFVSFGAGVVLGWLLDTINTQIGDSDG